MDTEPIVRWTVHRAYTVYHIPYLVEYIDRDDLLQAARIAAHNAIETYDPLRGMQLRTYIIFHAKNAIIDELRKTDRFNKNKVRNCLKYINIDDVDLVTEQNEFGFDETELGLQLRTAIDTLPPKLAYVMRAVCAGTEKQEIAKFLGVTPGRVAQLYAQGVEKLRRRMFAYSTSSDS